MKRLEQHSLIDGLDSLFKSVELKLPCVISIRNFDVFRVVKQLANALDIRSKFWQEAEKPKESGALPAQVHYYAILFENRITGAEISRLVWDFEQRV